MSELRRLLPGQLVLASHNPGKVSELRRLLEPHGFEVVAASALGLPEPDEIGETFAANAAIKAVAAARATGLPSLADDSGLIVAALGGQPGVRTADWAMLADGTRSYAAAMARVAREAGSNADRRCAFVSILALAWPDGHLQLHDGRVDGHWVYPPRGDFGFGYDPMFVPAGGTRTYGEMTPMEKAMTDHRARAFAALAAACLD